MKLPSLDGGSWIDIFGLVMIVRLLGPLFHLPPMNSAEAATWGATIASFAATNIGGPRT